jgi:hypothetical protein
MNHFTEEQLAKRFAALANRAGDSDWNEVRTRARLFRLSAHRPLVLVAALVVLAVGVGATLAGTLVLQAPRGVPGPRRADRVPAHGTIRWLFRHEPRGQSPAAAGIPTGLLSQPLRFARVIRPLPTGPLRIAVSLIGKRGLNVCMMTFDDRRALAGGCAIGWHLQAFKAMLLVRRDKVLFSGLASDSVARMAVFVSGGKPVAVPLRDNAFAVQIPLARFPANLVAYDSTGRVIQIDPWKRPKVL